MLMNHLLVTAVTLITLLAIFGIVFLWVSKETMDYTNCGIILFILGMLGLANIILLIYEFY